MVAEWSSESLNLQRSENLKFRDKWLSLAAYSINKPLKGQIAHRSNAIYRLFSVTATFPSNIRRKTSNYQMMNALKKAVCSQYWHSCILRKFLSKLKPSITARSPHNSGTFRKSRDNRFSNAIHPIWMKDRHLCYLFFLQTLGVQSVYSCDISLL
jgi:hypothetical protein